jgi:hypothetical protein
MGKTTKDIEAPEAAPVAVSGTPGKFVYVGDRFPYGPHRGFTPESVADEMVAAADIQPPSPNGGRQS